MSLCYLVLPVLQPNEDISKAAVPCYLTAQLPSDYCIFFVDVCRVIQFYLSLLFFSLPFVNPLCLLPLSFCFFLLKWFLHNSCHSSVVRASKTNSVWSFQCRSRVSRLHFMHALESYCPYRTIIFLESIPDCSVLAKALWPGWHYINLNGK